VDEMRVTMSQYPQAAVSFVQRSLHKYHFKTAGTGMEYVA